MTRLSEALRKAAAETASQPVSTEATTIQPDSVPVSAWQFSQVETMHVPQEGGPEPATPLNLQGNGANAGAVTIRPPAPALPKTIRVGDADRSKLIVGEHPDGAMIEQYRHLGAVLHHANKASGVRSVMVTSAMPSEGKTLTATNLALTLSESYQRRVLLIDADLRRPRLREMFALPAGEGLTDSLIASSDGQLPVHQVTQHLWVLAAGRTVPDPMSLLVSPAMKQLLDDACVSFDWVVVDTPPIAILPDANLLSAMIDTALLVVSARSTPYPMVQRAAQAIGANRILGVVLNRAEKGGMPIYSYYGSSQYPNRAAAPRPKRWFRWPRKSTSASAPPQGHGHVQ